jgi:HlyD family type I secretion membrane fusion protein
MSARSDNLGTQGVILRQRIDQLNTRIKGMQNEITAKDDQIALVDDEISRFEILMERGQAVITRVLALKRDRARLQGEKDALTSEIAATRVQIGEARSEIARLDQDNTETLLTELRDVQTQISELTEERLALLDRSTRLDITAPRSGRVIGIKAHTVGGVIRSSEPIMYIVPENDQLVAKVRINPIDIDKITTGQPAVLRFSAFNQEETPQFDGRVIAVSADALIDEATPVIVLAPSDALFEKTVSNTAEVMARGGPVIFITDEEGARRAPAGVRLIVAPGCDDIVAPLVYAVPIQMLAYYVAVQKGADVDQPRNLAKSVTVE